MATLQTIRNKAKQSTKVQTYTVLAGVLIVLLLVTAVSGLITPHIYANFAPPKYVQESRAQDLITLVLGVPLLLAAVAGAHKALIWALPLWAGVLAFELYVYAIYAVGGVYNVFFLGYVAIAGLSLYSMIGLLGGDITDWLQRSVQANLPRCWIGVFFVAITAVFATIWISQIINTINTGIVDSGHLILVLDLMIVLPAFGVTAVNLFRNQAFGDLLAGMLLIKFNSLCIAITLGQLFRYLNDISVESGLLGIFGLLGVIGLAFTAIYFKGLLGHQHQSRNT
jgi:hypothetical protein